MYKGKELEQILPHRGKMVLIDEVLSFDGDKQKLIAETEIRPEILFYDDEEKSVPIWVGLEYMAQAVAAYAGIFALKNGDKPKLGFLLGARSYQCFEQKFNLNDVLQIEVNELYSDQNLGSFSCSIARNKKKIAAAEVNVFQPESIEEFLKNAER